MYKKVVYEISLKSNYFVCYLVSLYLEFYIYLNLYLNIIVNYSKRSE